MELPRTESIIEIDEQGRVRAPDDANQLLREAHPMLERLAHLLDDPTEPYALADRIAAHLKMVTEPR